MDTITKTDVSVGDENRSLLWFILPAMAIVVIAGLTWRGEADLGPVTARNLNERIADAKTASDHEALAAYVRAQAASMDAKVMLHEAMKEAYDSVGRGTMDAPCDSLIRAEQQVQQAFADLAEEQEKLAQAAAVRH